MRDSLLGWLAAPGRRYPTHLGRLLPALRDLHLAGRSNRDVLAVLVAESLFRPRPARALEYLVWAFRSWTGRPVERLSVGMAQAQLRHWERLGLLDGTGFSFRRMRVVRDPAASYEVCRRFLAERDLLGEPPERIALAYAGGPRVRYPELVARARRDLEEELGEGLRPSGALEP